MYLSSASFWLRPALTASCHLLYLALPCRMSALVYAMCVKCMARPEVEGVSFNGGLERSGDVCRFIRMLGTYSKVEHARLLSLAEVLALGNLSVSVQL